MRRTHVATKSAALLGLGTDAVVEVATDPAGAMIPSALRDAIGAARASGAVPFAVIGTAGTTVTSAFDDLDALADICQAESLWLHVDGCYGGSALFSKRHRYLLRGVERSDSFVWNLHKMMGMTQQCTALLVRDPTRLAPCFAGQADYLFQPDKLNADYDSGDRTFQCARRVDVLKLWLAWKHHGDDGFAARIDHAVAMADHARRRIADSGGRFAVVVAGGFTNVVFAWVPPAHRPLDLDPGSIAALPAGVAAELHALAPAIKAEMQRQGTAMVGYQPIAGLNTFRLLFMNPAKDTKRLSEPFRRTTYSFRRLSAREAGKIRPLRLLVVRTGPRESIRGLSKTLPYGRYNESWFRVLNDMKQGQRLAPGSQVKVVAA